MWPKWMGIVLRRFSKLFSNQKPQDKTRRLSWKPEGEAPEPTQLTSPPSLAALGRVAPCEVLQDPSPICRGPSSGGTQAGWGERLHGQMIDIGEKQLVSLALLGPILFPMVERKPVGECNIVVSKPPKSFRGKGD